MDFENHKKRKLAASTEEEILLEKYPHCLQMFTLPPVESIDLNEFESLAAERLRLLRVVELAGQKGHKPLSNDWRDCIFQELHREKLSRFAKLLRNMGPSGPTDSKPSLAELQARRADHISNFILQLAYCRSESLRRWFIHREVDLFKLRFMELSPPSVEYFLTVNELTYQLLSESEKDSLRSELSESTAGMQVLDSVNFYRVPFVQVPNLVKGRRVLVRNGFAYIPSTELVVCIANVFKMKLTETLAYTYRELPIFSDERLNDLLSKLHSSYTGKEYVSNADKNKVNASALDGLSKQHYPLCMRHIHDSLRADHHMKHSSRLQYGLFTKAIGLSLEEALAFWREEFTKKMAADKFEKNYTYSLRHIYGQVGRMVQYSAYSCLKIINQNVGLGEHHGCPFRHVDPSVLKQKLYEYGINKSGVNDIMESVGQGHFQIACGKYYEQYHGHANKNGINHPNQYFEDSRSLLEGSKENKSNNTVPANLSESMVVDDVKDS